MRSIMKRYLIATGVFVFAGQLVGVGIVAGNGMTKQLDRYMPGVADEGHLYASCGSEASVRVTGPEKFDSILKPRGDGFVLNGCK